MDVNCDQHPAVHPAVHLVLLGFAAGAAIGIFLGTTACWGQSVDPRPFIPATEDAELQAAFNDPDRQWYTVETRPPIFQHRGRFHSIYEDIGPGGPRYSNGNGEWPWAHPSVPVNDGRTRNIIGAKIAGYRTYRVAFQQYGIVRVHDPRGAYSYLERQGTHPGIGWEFGEGTDIIELVTNRIGRADYTFKVHRMTLQDGEWFFRVYRPFTNQKSYEDATDTKAVYVGEKAIASNHHIPAFAAKREIWKVPRVDAEKARQLLLSTPFSLAAGDEFIPTTDHTDQVYPRGYLGAYIGNATNQEDCRTCHRQVAINVRKFDSGEWYGQIRGGGKDRHGVGVFSWYPR